MYRKVLLPLDGSSESEKVISLIRRELAPDTEVMLLKVDRPIRTQFMGNTVILGSQREEVERLETLSYLRSLIIREGKLEHWRYKAVVASSTSEGIVQTAQKEGVDLIAMYVPERRGLARLVKGDIAREVQQKVRGIEVRTFGPHDLVEGRIMQGAPVVVAANAQPGANGDSRASKATDVLQKPPLMLRGLKDVDLFKELSPEQIDAVASLGVPLSVPFGEVLGRGGQAVQELFVIIEGEAQLSFHSDMGDITVRVAGPGESFPMAALLEEGALITTGKALTDMELLSIPRDSLIELCTKDTDIGMKVYRAAAQQFASRYSNTLTHLAISAERELRDLPNTRQEVQDCEAGWLT
jgi:CRP/FNR family cyclic AMP-dependent transcriptional regulator